MKIVQVIWENFSKSFQLIPLILKQVISTLYYCELKANPKRNPLEILTKAFEIVVVGRGLNYWLKKVYENDLVYDYCVSFNYLLMENIPKEFLKLLKNQLSNKDFNTLIQELLIPNKKLL